MNGKFAVDLQDNVSFHHLLCLWPRIPFAQRAVADALYVVSVADEPPSQTENTLATIDIHVKFTHDTTSTKRTRASLGQPTTDARSTKVMSTWEPTYLAANAVLIEA